MDAHERRALPEGWECKKLIDALLTLENGSRPKGGVDNISEGVPSIGGEHVNKDGGFIFENIKFIPKEFYGDMRRGRIEIGDVLVVKDGATTGKVSLVRDDYPYQESAVNEHVFICRPNQKYVLPEYLFYNLFSPLGKNKILRSFHGAAQGGINTQFANDYEIPLPPLPTQRRIVSILEKAEETKRLRAQADELTNRLLKSVFLEMFGDPVGNPKEWYIVTLNNVCDKITDGTHQKPTYIEKGVPFLSVKNITKGYLDLSDIKYISLEEHEKLIRRCKPEEGDILYTKVGVNYGIAELVSINTEFSIYVSLALLKPNHKIINSKFFKYVLNSNYVKRQAIERISGIGVPDLHLIEIKQIKLPLPPLPLQQKFARIVEKIESMRQSQNQSKQQIEDLFSALMQKAFRGEI